MAVTLSEIAGGPGSYDFFSESLPTAYADRGYQWKVHYDRARRSAVSRAILATAAVAAALTLEPWYLAFSTSIGMAIAWCRWLDRHASP